MEYENFIEARRKTISNAWQILKIAVFLFEKNNYNISCFLAMTSIEETGKLIALIQLHMFGTNTINDITPKSMKFFKDHRKKAINATGAYLYTNIDADKRHGIDPSSKIHRTAGVFLLGLSHKWMEIRNKCLYTDINLRKNTSSNPKDSISREYAYYFICMGFEVLCSSSIELDSKIFWDGSDFFKFLGELMAEIISIDNEKIFYENVMDSVKDWKKPLDANMIPKEIITPWVDFYKKIVESDVNKLVDQKAIKFKHDRLLDLEKFMEKWLETIDLSKIDFLNNPDPLLKIVKDKEDTQSLSKCVAKYLTPFKISDDKKMSIDELMDFFINKSNNYQK